MKKHFISIKLLFIGIITIPIVIFALSKFVDEDTLKGLYENTIERLGLSQSTVIENSIKEVSRGVGGNTYAPALGGDYVWGAYDQLYSDWSLPYTVTQEQYGEDSNLVGYCCYLGWPTIK